MNDSKKLENGSLSKKHFAKIHERVHNKYVAMQKKLEKSRSVDSLSSLSDNSSFRHSSDFNNSDIKYDEVFETKRGGNNNNNIIKHNVIVEDVNKCDAILRDYEVVPVYESVVTPSIDSTNHEYNKRDSLVFFEDNWNLSLESIYDTCRDKQDEDTEQKHDDDIQATSPTKVSLRYRIGERLSAARERRREAREKKKDKEKMEKLILSNKLEDLEIASKDTFAKKKNKVASVAVAVIDASEPENETQDKDTEEKSRQLLHCRIRLGTEKRKTKMARKIANKVTWQELFNISLYDKYLLEVTVWDKDTFIGRCSADLKTLEEERTYRKRLNLEECATQMQLYMLITVTGTLNNLIIQSEDEQKIVGELRNNYIQEVGLLHIQVYKASGLPENSDKICLIELVNDRQQTQTEYKTGEPQWMKAFIFDVKDVTAILSISVLEEKKSEPVVLGRILIPLLSIENDVEKWYALKDSTLTTRAKGTSPKILLKMTLVYSTLKASVRCLTPKEAKLLQTTPEFDRRVFANNVSRVKVILAYVYDVTQILKGLFEGSNPVKNFIVLVIWIFFWLKFKQWMLPLLLLIPFLLYSQSETLAKLCKIFTPVLNWINKFDSGSGSVSDNKQETLGTDETSKPLKKKEERSKTFLERVRSVTEIITTVQTDMGIFASYGESVKNLVNFSVPFLSELAIKFIMMFTVVLYFISFRHLLIGWAIWKYLRKLLRPNRIPNNEILDLISRVPDDETLLNCQELPLADGDDKEESGIRRMSSEIVSTST